ncbi:lantibiotic dehydratase C-terminal domain-containing protein [Amycolatopsis circi]|uniref:lantibiotic dehydratase C-terminal domain-containing protein n=1 Tax=Amycolatopsis circi TaxID=871959 RepID=UPI000E23ED16|nr:lantibiotic dehydratase C-terminal domain-containing protein [Amycolatopsis circi]
MNDDWISMHIFYAGNSDALLVECVAPLVAQLRSDGLLGQYFFIRYWLAGPHVRLRLRPARAENADEVRRRAEDSVNGFLTRHPALYEPDFPGADEMYRRLGIAEYGDAWWTERFGADGAMVFDPNNSFRYVPYEPEYRRYGGLAATRLAEWHFESSSDLVLRLTATANVHIRPVLLGLSLQLSLIMCYAFLETDGAVAWYLDRSRRFWETSFIEDVESTHAAFERSWKTMSGQLSERVHKLRKTVRIGSSSLSVVEREWFAHCTELRDRIVELATSGQILLKLSEDSDLEPAPRPNIALSMLMTSYIHMTNNRLGVTIFDEVYLSYLLERTLAVPSSEWVTP